MFWRGMKTLPWGRRGAVWLVFFVPCQVFLAFDMQCMPYMSWLFLTVYSIFVLYFLSSLV